jgi:hypothetical protein
MNHTKVDDSINFALAKNVFGWSAPDVYTVVNNILWQSRTWPAVEAYHLMMSVETIRESTSKSARYSG